MLRGIAAHGSVHAPRDISGRERRRFALRSAVTESQETGGANRTEYVILLPTTASATALVPWPDIHLGTAGEIALGRKILEQSFDSQRASWPLRVDYPRFRAPGLVVAANPEVLEDIIDVCKAAGVRLRVIIPLAQLGCAVAAKREQQVVALTDGGGGIVGALRNRAWIALRQSPGLRDSAAMSIELKREARLHSTAESVASTALSVAADASLPAFEALAVALRSIDERVNFAPDGRSRWPAYLLLGGSIAFAAFAMHAAWQAKITLDGELERASRRTIVDGPVIPPRDALAEQKLTAETDALRDAARVLAIPWADLLRALEKLPAADVALLSIQPQPDLSAVFLTLEARRFDALIDYLRAISDRPEFANPVLLSFQTQQQDVQKPVRARIRFDWIRPSTER